MDESRLRVSSKIKITETTNNDPNYQMVGDIGYLVNDSCFHFGELTDNEGDYWVHIPKRTFCTRYCLKATKFKVLKY